MALFDGIDFNTDMSGGFGKKDDVPSDKGELCLCLCYICQ